MKFLVIKLERCPRCEGVGIIQHPSWERYWEEFKKHFVNRYPSPEEEYEFGRDFWSFEGEDLDRLPPEEIECYKCKGLGEIRSEVPLEEALAEIKRWS